MVEHVSLDGFVAGPNGNMGWIKADDELFDFGKRFTDNADAVIYGRVTYGMMAAYWPTAADRPGASRHDVVHGRWVNAALKVVVSRTLESVDWPNTRIVKDDVGAAIRALKDEPGKDILMYGSPTLAHTFMELDLIDDYWLFLNPVALGQGMPLFGGFEGRLALSLVESHVLASGVVGLHYVRAS
jgi:dihydrofolate reductase